MTVNFCAVCKANEAYNILPYGRRTNTFLEWELSTSARNDVHDPMPNTVAAQILYFEVQTTRSHCRLYGRLLMISSKQIAMDYASLFRCVVQRLTIGDVISSHWRILLSWNRYGSIPHDFFHGRDNILFIWEIETLQVKWNRNEWRPHSQNRRI